MTRIIWYPHIHEQDADHVCATHWVQYGPRFVCYLDSNDFYWEGEDL